MEIQSSRMCRCVWKYKVVECVDVYGKSCGKCQYSSSSYYYYYYYVIMLIVYNTFLTMNV